MSIYMDTSSLLKIYVDEDGTENVRRLAAEASAVFTSIATYAEARAALAALRRRRLLSRAKFAAAKTKLEADWQCYTTVEVTMELVREAGQFAERYRLRGCDSLHLASYAETLRRKGADGVTFSCFDTHLDKAAQALASRLAGRKPAWQTMGENN